MKTPHKIAFISLGCAKNLVDSENMLHLLSEAGYSLTGDCDGADAAVVNTCGFIDSAKSEAIDVILSLAGLKSDGRLGKIIVAGCLPERYRDEFLKELPEVDAVVGVGRIADIAAAVEGTLEGGSPALFAEKGAPVAELGRAVTTGPGWAYIKIAEGCDNRCAYCAIPEIRGPFRSRDSDSIIAEAETLAAAGVRELIVVAQDITRYGLDRRGEPRLSELLARLCAIEGFEWIRLHYLYPDEITDELIGVIAREEKILKYLDIPIQHISDRVLKAMNRRGDGSYIRGLFSKLRDEIPGVVLRTSLITGLPCEGEDEFDELMSFLSEARIERAGVFPYSPEEGTPAAEMTNRVDSDEAQRRADAVMAFQSGVMDDFTRSLAGKTLSVICQGKDAESGLNWGRSWADSPDVDSRVLFSGECAPGEFCDIFITGESDGEPVGHAVEEGKR